MGDLDLYVSGVLEVYSGVLFGFQRLRILYGDLMVVELALAMPTL